MRPAEICREFLGVPQDGSAGNCSADEWYMSWPLAQADASCLMASSYRKFTSGPSHTIRIVISTTQTADSTVPGASMSSIR